MIKPPAVEESVGMEAYASPAPPCPAMIRRNPEDFQVEEALGGLEVKQEPLPNFLPLYRIQKRLIDTFHLERELSEALRSRVSFAGLKDKRAVAVQYATPTSTHSRRPQSIQGDRFRAELVGYVERPVSRGMITGNSFRIVLRDCCTEVEDRIDDVFELAEAGRVPNYFGLQRFGASGATTHRVGGLMVRGDFEEAVRILLCEPRRRDDQEASEARELFSQGKYGEGCKLLPKHQDTERLVARLLGEKPGDFVGGLRRIPIRLRRLYTQAYQSFIFNRALSRAMKRGLDLSRPETGDNWGEVTSDGLVLEKVHGTREPWSEGVVPLFQLVGYSYRNYGSRFDACVEEILTEERVAARDFFIREMQETSVEGGFRRPHIVARALSHGPAFGGALLSFTLARGQYATVLVREIVKPQDPFPQGFA